MRLACECPCATAKFLDVLSDPYAATLWRKCRQVNESGGVGAISRGLLAKNPHSTCAVKRRWSTAGESPARELGSLHPEAIGAAVEETKPSEPPV